MIVDVCTSLGQIAKDMERWAKTVNAAAKTVQQHTSYATQQGVQQQEAVTVVTPRQLSPEPQRPKGVTLSSVLVRALFLSYHDGHTHTPQVFTSFLVIFTLH